MTKVAASESFLITKTLLVIALLACLSGNINSLFYKIVLLSVHRVLISSKSIDLSRSRTFAAIMIHDIARLSSVKHWHSHPQVSQYK